MNAPAEPGAARDAAAGEPHVAAQREGAQANAEGRSPDENPYLLPKNMPAMTGEPLRLWARKNDAWREGFNEARRATAGAADRHKQALPPALLTTMVNRRVRWLPEVLRALELDAHAVLRIHRPVRHQRDALARNWDIDGFECGAVSEADCPEQFRSIVDHLRDEFDLR